MSQLHLLHRPSEGTCWICGRSAKATSEHKFKASDLRRHFGTNSLYLGSWGNEGSGRIAQGPRSSLLKFKSMICEDCNTSVTQDADRAYDLFVSLIEVGGSNNEAIEHAIADARFVEGSERWQSLLRYFAKLLGCHLADIQAPIPRLLSDFAGRRTHANCIWLHVWRDELLDSINSQVPVKFRGYAAHDGVVVQVNRHSFLPTGVQGEYVIGSVGFTYRYDYSDEEVVEMQESFSDFVELSASRAKETLARSNPLTNFDQQE